jgi:SET domain-containing protein
MPLSSKEHFQLITTEGTKARSLFTTRAFKASEAIYQLDYWSQELMPMHVTNHSCAPNASFNKAGRLTALRDIPANEEITYNYLDTPTPASPWNFECHCGTENCVGWVKAG